MVFLNNMWSYDDLPVGMLIQPRDENLLIRLPRRSGNEALAATLHLFHYWQLLGCCLYLQYSVKTGITHHLDIRNTYLGKKFLAHLVLYIETGETLQYVSILASVPAEKDLTRAEDTADTIDGNTTMAKNMQVVILEFILDKERHHRTNGP